MSQGRDPFGRSSTHRRRLGRLWWAAVCLPGCTSTSNTRRAATHEERVIDLGRPPLFVRITPRLSSLLMAVYGLNGSVYVQYPRFLQEGFIGTKEAGALPGFNGLSGLVLKSPTQ